MVSFSRSVLAALIVALTMLPATNLGLNAAKAAEPEPFCPVAQKRLAGDARLAAAVTAAFGPVTFKPAKTPEGSPCTYPLQVLSFATADVLLTTDGVPGEGCHGCGASLSAFFLKHEAGGLKLVGRDGGFGETGTNGNPGEIKPIRFAGDDGIAIVSGGTFQGYSTSVLDLFLFRHGHAEHIAAAEAIVVDADNSGAVTQSRRAVTVTGRWSLDPGVNPTLTVDYRVRARGRSSASHVVWSLKGNQLVITSGRVPAEVAQASGD